jgi:hypothetical protein
MNRWVLVGFASNELEYRFDMNIEKHLIVSGDWNRDMSNKSRPLIFVLRPSVILYNPSEDLKSGIPALHDIPAPVRNTILLLLLIFS